MNINDILEFQTIRSQLAELALSDRAKCNLLSLSPFLSESECKRKMRETTDGAIILNANGNPPLTAMKELDKILILVQKGSMLTAEQLTEIAQFSSACRRMKSYLKKAEALDVDVAFYGGSLYLLSDLFDEIERTIRNGAVDDGASPGLRNIRRKLENANAAVKAKLSSILSSKKEWFVDGYVTTRAGKFVLPVKREYKNQMTGTVIETSATRNTCFIEPAAVHKLQEEITSLQTEEENEIRIILYTLTALVDTHRKELELNRECMETLDVIFAKAKLSAKMNAIAVPLTTDRKIVILQGRHPLLKEDSCVPLDFEIGNDIRGIIITGPNTGGKTVALKTVGLLSLMAQSGLHVPVSKGSTFCMHSNILCDIGDGQSITENLSTFSAHITNIIQILKHTAEDSLVLLDELGSGTDPAEGMGLAIAILEELRQKDCLFVATTHYPEIKEFAKSTESVVNARMEFDRESLQPLYRLQIGEAGESCALYIAQRLGFPSHMLNLAYTHAYGAKKCSQISGHPIDFSMETAQQTESSAPKIKKEAVQKPQQQKGLLFQIGDSVTVFPQKEIGIVYRCSDEKGMLGVQLKGKKQLINHKRLKLLTPASELYPEDYDFSIIFDTVENRKARHKMGKRHQPGLEITLEED